MVRIGTPQVTRSWFLGLSYQSLSISFSDCFRASMTLRQGSSIARLGRSMRLVFGSLVLGTHLSVNRPVADQISLPLNQGRWHCPSLIHASREEPARDPESTVAVNNLNERFGSLITIVIVWSFRTLEPQPLNCANVEVEKEPQKEVACSSLQFRFGPASALAVN